MAKIHVLNQDTINKIAAGEVIERPMAVVKELIENAIDAGATSITVEIQDGGKSLIRITDNGSGMEEDDIELAFLPHATSKIQDVTDLLSVSSLGFRGEALASIASVSMLEMVTKTKESLMGTRYQIDGGEKKTREAVGCPEGTTFLVRNLFYNTPARLKFLKTSQTEAGYICGLIERMALSHPEIAFRFINQKQSKITTSGNGNLKDVIYHIYGRDITANLIEVTQSEVFCKISGFLGKPVISRGNRAMMNYFINGRYIKSQLITKAIEEAYAPYVMQHRYPFTVLHFKVDPQYIDVNVHPQKMEIRFHNEKEIYQSVLHGISEALKYREYIPEVTFQTTEERKEEKKIWKQNSQKNDIEPFEMNRKKEQSTLDAISNRSDVGQKVSVSAQRIENQDHKAQRIENQNLKAQSVGDQDFKVQKNDKQEEPPKTVYEKPLELHSEKNLVAETVVTPKDSRQISFFEEGILSNRTKNDIKIIGQVFSTYWILQYQDTMYLVDQHAAHEKVLYERFMKELLEKKPMSQLLEPPIIVSFSMMQQQVVEEHRDIFEKLGYQLESFGGKEYAVTGVPAHLPKMNITELLLEVVDSLVEEHGRKRAPDVLTEKVASMSCKAAVKGNNKLPVVEMEALLQELMTLENPYHCPHGRPTMISMTKTELEKRFKRIV